MKFELSRHFLISVSKKVATAFSDYGTMRALGLTAYDFINQISEFSIYACVMCILSVCMCNI